MKKVTQVNTRIIYTMAKENMYGAMDGTLRVNGRMEKCMVLVYIIGLMEEDT